MIIKALELLQAEGLSAIFTCLWPVYSERLLQTPSTQSHTGYIWQKKMNSDLMCPKSMTKLTLHIRFLVL